MFYLKGTKGNTFLKFHKPNTYLLYGSSEALTFILVDILKGLLITQV